MGKKPAADQSQKRQWHALAWSHLLRVDRGERERGTRWQSQEPGACLKCELSGKCRLQTFGNGGKAEKINKFGKILGKSLRSELEIKKKNSFWVKKWKLHRHNASGSHMILFHLSAYKYISSDDYNFVYPF